MDEYDDKPYEFVRLPEKPPQRQRGAGHHHFAADRLSGQLVAALIAKRPVQVGSGTFEVQKTKEGEEVVAETTTIMVGGKKVRILPGSSLKGVLRSVVEAISPSCIRVASWRTRKAIPDPLRACDNLKRLCPACRMFGMTGRGRENYLGQIQVAHARVLQGKATLVRTPLLWTPARRGRDLPGRYLSGAEIGGRKFYYHGTLAKGPDLRLVLGSGSILAFQIDFANLTAAEMGLLLIALGQHPDYPFWLKVGGGKPVGLGTVEPKVVELDLLGQVSATGRAGAGRDHKEGAALTQASQGWIEAADSLLDKQALADLWAVWRPDNLSRPSPDEAY